MFVSMDLLGTKGKILSFAQKMSKTLRTLIYCFLIFDMLDTTRNVKYYEKWKDFDMLDTGQNLFITGNIVFFQNFVF